MVKAKAARSGCKRHALSGPGRHGGRPFLFGAIYIGRYFLTMPVQQLRVIRAVDDINRHRLALFEAQ
jgi:hypothetical protein